MKKQELRNEVNRLLNIIKRQSDQIDKLIVLVENTRNPQTLRIIGANDDMCIDGGPHDWPNPWFATVPPHCKKCGQQAPGYNITCGTTFATDTINSNVPSFTTTFGLW